jgi:hypothetical protein
VCKVSRGRGDGNDRSREGELQSYSGAQTSRCQAPKGT